MPRIATYAQDILSSLTPARRLDREVWQLWHLCKIVVPRRSISGRFIWGVVLRRMDDGRWIYKRYDLN
jgi:hypothetical protein